jgi:hypothetical protein
LPGKACHAAHLPGQGRTGRFINMVKAFQHGGS